ncbi:hypothetical protein JMUB6875_02990 [Nocardia sp. JMUB6875]
MDRAESGCQYGEQAGEILGEVAAVRPPGSVDGSGAIDVEIEPQPVGGRRRLPTRVGFVWL